MTRFAITTFSALSRRLKSRRGQSFVEYTLILSFLSFMTIAVMSVLGTQIQSLFTPIIRVLASL